MLDFFCLLLVKVPNQIYWFADTQDLLDSGFQKDWHGDFNLLWAW